MKIVEYKLHLNDNGIGMKIPYFIIDGGYFPDGNKLIGLMDNSKEYFQPVTTKNGGALIEYTVAELITRQQTLGMKDAEGEEMSNEEIATFITAWCSNKGIE